MPQKRNSMKSEEAKTPNSIDGFDIYNQPAEFSDNPYPYYRWLRENDPIHQNSDGSYYLTRYEDVLRVYRTAGMTSDKRDVYRRKFGQGPLFVHHTTTMLFRDPPSHTRLRKLITHFFTPRALGELEDRVVVLVDRLLDKCADQGGMDVLSEFAFTLPAEIICFMLAIPPAEREPLQKWSKAILIPLDPVTTPEAIERGNQAVEAFSEYLRGVIEERRDILKRLNEPNTLLDDLIVAQEQDGQLDYEELVQNCILLLNAGHETTSNLIGNGINALLEFPEQLERLRKDPGLIKTAVEEMLRFESPLQIGNRGVSQPIKIGDIELPVGTQILTSIGGANRDPAEFPDPDKFDIGRQPNRHVAFAGGIHACIGAPLARIEGRIAIGHLVARFPKLRQNGKSVRQGRIRFRGLQYLPVAV